MIMLNDFHIELARTARCCVDICNDRNLVEEKWCDMLSRILTNWMASVEIDLCEAVEYLLDTSGIFGSNLSYSSCDFWFLNSLDYQELCINRPRRDRVYYVTIAIFETLNYWCWHDAPLPITFNADTLATTLKEGGIYIDFSAYANYRKYSLLNLPFSSQL